MRFVGVRSAALQARADSRNKSRFRLSACVPGETRLPMLTHYVNWTARSASEKGSSGADYTPATLLQALNLQKCPMGWTQKQPTPRLQTPGGFYSAAAGSIGGGLEGRDLGHVTPHGLRSYFVTRARESGLSDAEIAMLI